MTFYDKIKELERESGLMSDDAECFSDAWQKSADRLAGETNYSFTSDFQDGIKIDEQIDSEDEIEELEYQLSMRFIEIYEEELEYQAETLIPVETPNGLDYISIRDYNRFENANDMFDWLDARNKDMEG